MMWLDEVELDPRHPHYLGRTGLEDLTDEQLKRCRQVSFQKGHSWWWAFIETTRRQDAEKARLKRVRCFGRKRRLLAVLRPLVKLTARMEGRA